MNHVVNNKHEKDIAYKAVNGKTVTNQDIAGLKDSELVHLYEFFKNYCNALKDMLETKDVVRDKQFVAHVSNMMSTKISLKSVVQKRKLRMIDFYPSKRRI